MLSQDQVKQFQRDGGLAVRKAIPADLLRRLRETFDEMQEESRPLTSGNKVFELEPDHSAQNPRLRRINHPVAHRPIFWETATHQQVLDCVAALIGENIKFHHSKLNAKVGGGGTEIGWHQDFVFFPHTNYDLIACGIALDDATTENGCLLVVPGTHKIGLMNHRDASGEFVGQITSDLDKFDGDSAMPIELEAGDMSIHHVCVVHGSLQNTSTRARRLLIFQYAATDAIQLDRRPLANEYSERVVRGAPATTARLAEATTIQLRGDISNARSIFDRQKSMAH